MSADLRLVIFDVDGTLVDSQGDIVGAMTRAFEDVSMAVPSRSEILGIVGLSLDVAMARLAPRASQSMQAAMVEGYKNAYIDMRAKVGAAQSSPLYPGARQVLDELQAVPHILLGVATGKSRRGLDKLLEAHELDHLFVTQQVADYHPSKPHPSMVIEAMRDVGVLPEQTVMIGDTSFDMQMAASAGVRGIGVSWGYHPVSALADAAHILDDFSGLPGVLKSLWGK
ncbi:MAG: HAD-IA family hydrolase [Roseobacter sp.]